MAYIFYTVSALDDNMPRPTPLSIPGMLKYSEGRFDKAMVKTLSGRVFNCTENSNLLENVSIQEVKCLNLGKGGIVSLAYCSDPDAFWVFFNKGNSFVKYDGTGIKLETINVKIGNLRNKPICVVANEKPFFRYTSVKYTCWKIHRRKCLLMPLLWQLHPFVQPKMTKYWSD